MERLRGKSLRRALLCGFAAVAVLLAVAGCGVNSLFQRSCQPPSGPVRNLEDAQWRLTFTNNPSQRYRAYDFRYSFEIWAFDRQFGFNVKRVIRNRQFNNPIQVGTYDTNGRDLLVLRLQSPGSGDGEEGTPPQDLGTATFRYSLGSKLELQDLRTGHIYRFHQFTGVVSPSQACVFK
jgi:hypothetical protein